MRCRVERTEGPKDARTSDTWTARARLKWIQPEPPQEMWGMMSQRWTSQPGSFPNLWLLNHKQNKRVVLTHFQLICYTQHKITRCDLKCLQINNVPHKRTMQQHYHTALGRHRVAPQEQKNQGTRLARPPDLALHISSAIIYDYKMIMRPVSL